MSKINLIRQTGAVVLTAVVAAQGYWLARQVNSLIGCLNSARSSKLVRVKNAIQRHALPLLGGCCAAMLAYDRNRLGFLGMGVITGFVDNGFFARHANFWPKTSQ